MALLPQPTISQSRVGNALRVVSNSELIASELKKEKEDKGNKELILSSLAMRINKCWQAAKDHKQEVEAQMMINLRQRRGIYEPDKLAAIKKFGGSEIFMRLTDAKCRTAASWVMDVISLEKPYALESTAVPSLPPDQAQKIHAEVQQEVMMVVQASLAAGMIVDQAALTAATVEAMEEQEWNALEALREEANEAMRLMEARIEDQLTEGGWQKALGGAIMEDFVTFGTMILKAPVIRSVRSRTWQPAGMGKYKAVVSDKIVPMVERVSPLDLYPSEDAEEVDSAGFLIEKYRTTRRNLRSFRAVPGFSAEAIDKVLLEMPKLKEWTDIDSERDDLEHKDADLGETIDVLIYHGDVQGQELLDWGMSPEQVPDPLDEVSVEAWKIGPYVVRAVLNDDPLHRRPYHKACLYPKPGSFWGIGIPELIADVQQMCNAVARALANNVAMASGPQVGVERERMPADEDGSRMWPWKVWSFDQSYGANNLPIQFFQPQSNAQELLYVYNEFTKIADEVSGIPSYVAGDSAVRGAGKTASGLSMLMNAAGKNVKSIILNLDEGVIRSVVAAMFDYNLQWQSDLPSYMGDAQVAAKGLAALQVRDQNAVRLQEFLTATNNPVDYQIMGPERRAELLRSVAKSLSLQPEDIAPDKKEMQQQQRQQEMMAAQAVNTGTPDAPKDLGPDGQPSQGTDYRLYNQG